MSIAIAIGFVFLILFILGGAWAQGPQVAPRGKRGPGAPPQNKKNEKNTVSGNGNAHANFDWYFWVLFSQWFDSI